MVRSPRQEVVDTGQVQVVHCVQRCVRRAFLCGEDEFSGQSYEHRRGWIRDRMKQLASVFGIDCLTYAIMHNHMHVVLRSRPDVVAAWTDREVAVRWLRLFPRRRTKDGAAVAPQKAEIDMLVNDAEGLAERRRRLSDVSWWMRCLAETIARRANREDECTGRFWEGRYKCQLILDEASLLACAAYVDLNPIRAAIAETPEASDFTGAQDRLLDLRQRNPRTRQSMHDWERSRRRERSGWLSPVEIDEKHDAAGVDTDGTSNRASHKGFLSLSLTHYLELLDWTGRELRSAGKAAIPRHLRPILKRIGLDGPAWCDLVKAFASVFKRAAGSADRLSQEAKRRGQAWMQAPGNPLLASAA